jgi:signal transduction histidine kinase
MNLLRGRVKRMESLLDDLLAYSSAGRGGAEVTQVDPAALLNEVVDLTTIPDGFDVITEAHASRFLGAETPLKIVLMNLVNNAIKHHDRASGVVRIVATDTGSTCEFRVEDDGPGIPTELRERAFQMFQTLRPRDEVEGSGIGLAMAKKLVEIQGGAIRLDDNPSGRGSVFTVTWPREPEQPVRA